MQTLTSVVGELLRDAHNLQKTIESLVSKSEKPLSGTVCRSSLPNPIDDVIVSMQEVQEVLHSIEEFYSSQILGKIK